MKIIEFSSNTEKGIAHKCATLYREIFHEPPWNEDWDIVKVIEDMYEQAAYPGFHGLFAMDDCEIIGFTWGYSVSCEVMQKIVGNDELNYLFVDGNCLFYIDELGVGPVCRGKGVGRKITQSLIEFAKNNGATSIVLRTDDKAEAAKKLYCHLGFENLNIKDGIYDSRTYWRLLI